MTESHYHNLSNLEVVKRNVVLLVKNTPSHTSIDHFKYGKEKIVPENKFQLPLFVTHKKLSLDARWHSRFRAKIGPSAGHVAPKLGWRLNLNLLYGSLQVHLNTFTYTLNTSMYSTHWFPTKRSTRRSSHCHEEVDKDGKQP